MSVVACFKIAKKLTYLLKIQDFSVVPLNFFLQNCIHTCLRFRAQLEFQNHIYACVLTQNYGTKICSSRKLGLTRSGHLFNILQCFDFFQLEQNSTVVPLDCIRLMKFLQFNEFNQIRIQQIIKILSNEGSQTGVTY